MILGMKDRFSDVDVPGIPAVSPDPPGSSLTELGAEADASFKLGSTDLAVYTSSLESFVRSSFPVTVQRSLIDALSRYVSRENDSGGTSLWKRSKGISGAVEYKNIWQTDKQVDIEEGLWSRKNPGWKWTMLGDAEAGDWVRKELGGSRMEELWNELPLGIMVSGQSRGFA